MSGGDWRGGASVLQGQLLATVQQAYQNAVQQHTVTAAGLVGDPELPLVAAAGASAQVHHIHQDMKGDFSRI